MFVARKDIAAINLTLVTVAPDIAVGGSPPPLPGQPYDPASSPQVQFWRVDPATGVIALDIGVGASGFATMEHLSITNPPVGVWQVPVDLSGATFDHYRLLFSYLSPNTVDQFTIYKWDDLWLSTELQIIDNEYEDHGAGRFPRTTIK